MNKWSREITEKRKKNPVTFQTSPSNSGSAHISALRVLFYCFVRGHTHLKSSLMFTWLIWICDMQRIKSNIMNLRLCFWSSRQRSNSFARAVFWSPAPPEGKESFYGLCSAQWWKPFLFAWRKSCLCCLTTEKLVKKKKKKKTQMQFFIW